MMGVPDNAVGQMEDAAFWEVDGEYGLERRPIDGHAVYGSMVLGGTPKDGDDVPNRRGARDLVTAIRSARPGDRVVVNGDTEWMDVVELPDGQWVDEGFACVPENGSVTYAVRPRNPRDSPPGTFDEPWMRRWDDGRSAGGVDSLEVDWADR